MENLQHENWSVSGIEKCFMTTHTDLDGVGCEIAARAAFSNISIKSVDVDKFDTAILQQIANLKSEMNPGKEYLLLITDMSPKLDSTVEKLEELSKMDRCHVKLIDHHLTADQFIGNRDWTLIDSSNKYSATFILLKWLRMLFVTKEQKMCKLDNLRKLARIISDYDTWHHEEEQPVLMNRLLKIIGYKNFCDRADSLNEPSLFNFTEMAMLRCEESREKEYINRVLQSGNYVPAGKRMAFVVFADQYQSAIGEESRVNNIEADFIAIINMSTKEVSLRSINPGYDVSALAKHFGGGGHKLSAGFSIHKKSVDAFTANIFGRKHDYEHITY